jgi:hypothetical protein
LLVEKTFQLAVAVSGVISLGTTGVVLVELLVGVVDNAR